MCHGSQIAVSIAVVVDRDVLDLDELLVDLLVVAIRFILRYSVLFELLLLFLFNRISITY